MLTDIVNGNKITKPPTQFSKTGALTGLQFLEGVDGEKGRDFFQDGFQFLLKK